MQLGFNNIIKYDIPKIVQVKARKNKVIIFSIEKCVLSEQVMLLRSCRFPDVYRGKGIRLKNEFLKFKTGKQR
jgi:large subunit ribosomal protein L6